MGGVQDLIRQAEAHDEQDIRKCAEQAYARYMSLMGRKPAPMIADIAAQIATGDVYVATDDRDIFQGFITFYQEDDHIRPENRKEDRVDRRLAEHQTGTCRVVVAFRQRKGRTLTFVTKNEAEGVQIAKKVVCRMATISADEASHWDALHAGWETYRIKRSEAYSDGGKGCTNQVESFFARLRRMVRGQHHLASPKFLYQYANISTQTTPHGWRFTVTVQTVAMPSPCLAARSSIRYRVFGLDTGSGLRFAPPSRAPLVVFLAAQVYT